MRPSFSVDRPLSCIGSTPGLLIIIVLAFFTGCSDEAGDPALYRKYCATCHGPDGEGLRALYPALDGSEYTDQKLQQLPCLIVNGAGKKIVMPAFPQLEVAEITNIVTYLNSRWAATRTTVSEEQVATWLQNCH